jgi:hypothetical protein
MIEPPVGSVIRLLTPFGYEVFRSTSERVGWWNMDNDPYDGDYQSWGEVLSYAKYKQAVIELASWKELP